MMTAMIDLMIRWLSRNDGQHRLAASKPKNVEKKTLFHAKLGTFDPKSTYIWSNGRSFYADRAVFFAEIRF